MRLPLMPLSSTSLAMTTNVSEGHATVCFRYPGDWVKRVKVKQGTYKTSVAFGGIKPGYPR